MINIISMMQRKKMAIIDKMLQSFPDFDDHTLDGIEFPSGFDDASYSKDTCPAVTDETAGVKIYIDYLNERKRQMGGARFALYFFDAAVNHYDFVLESDEWREILEGIFQKQIV